MNALIVVNPHAGRQQILREIEEVQAFLEGRGHTVAVRRTESPQKARQVIAEEAGAADTLVCCGGDGTLSETIGQLLDLGAAVTVGYIPAGTTNDFARFLHIPRRPLKAAQFLAETPPRPLDVGLFGERPFIYVASFGAFTKSSYATDPNLKHALGHLAYVLESLRELPELRPYRLRAETAEGEVFEGEYLFGAVSDSTSIGGVFKPDPATVDPADGKFELLLVRNPRSLGEFNRIAGSLLSGDYDPELVTFTHTGQVEFTCAEPMPWTLDGEYAPGGERVTVRVLPRAVNMVY